MQYSELPYPHNRALAEKDVKEYFAWDFDPTKGILIYGFDLTLKATLTKTDIKKAFTSTKKPATNQNNEPF
jgi:hypothetical protein